MPYKTFNASAPQPGGNIQLAPAKAGVAYRVIAYSVTMTPNTIGAFVKDNEPVDTAPLSGTMYADQFLTTYHSNTYDGGLFETPKGSSLDWGNKLLGNSQGFIVYHEI